MTDTATDTEGRMLTVHLVQVVSTSVDIDPTDGITDIDEAADFGAENAPPPTNSSNSGIDPAGEWVPTSIVDVATGEEVWRDDHPFGPPPAPQPNTDPQPILIYGSTTQSVAGGQGNYTLDIRDGDDKPILAVTLTPDQAWRMVQNVGPARGTGQVYR